MKPPRTLAKITRLAATVIAVDLISKALAGVAFAGATTGVILPIENRHFALGIASAPLPVMLGLMTSGILIAGILTTRGALAGSFPPWVPALLIGGSVANLVDRALFGAVHDFLATPWAVLNVADLAVLAAVVQISTTHLRFRKLVPIEGG